MSKTTLPPSAWEKFKNYVSDPMRGPSIVAELKYAVEDIRQKVVEEATYGRATTPSIGIHGAPDEPKADMEKPDPFADRCRDVARPTPSYAQDQGHDVGPER